jgi:hypothetical protein
MSAGRNINSISQDWNTPIVYVEAIDEFFNNKLDLDPCSNEQSLVKSQTKYMLPKNDGLAESWNYKNIYVNPPYGRNKINKTGIKDWIKKCYNSFNNYDSEVIALIPVASNTSHWKSFIWNKATAICFLFDVRLKFSINGSTDNKGAPMACCIVYWGINFEYFNKIFSKFGAVVKL